MKRASSFKEIEYEVIGQMTPPSLSQHENIDPVGLPEPSYSSSQTLTNKEYHARDSASEDPALEIEGANVQFVRSRIFQYTPSRSTHVSPFLRPRPAAIPSPVSPPRSESE